MLLVLVGLTAAVVTGWLLGGSLTRLAAQPVRSARLLQAALAAQLVGAVVPGGYVVGLAGSAVLVALAVRRDRRLPGMRLVGLGLALNAVVVGLNGAMPVTAAAAERAGLDLTRIAAGADPRHELAVPETRLPWLGDVLPLPWPGWPEVVSAGDVVLLAGLGWLVVAGMRRAPRRYVVPAAPAPGVSPGHIGPTAPSPQRAAARTR